MCILQLFMFKQDGKNIRKSNASLVRDRYQGTVWAKVSLNRRHDDTGAGVR